MSVASQAMRLAEQIVGLRPVRESCWPAFRFLPGPREKPAGLRPAARPTPGLIDRARARIRAGQTSCIALVEEALGAIAARNGELNAFVEVLEAGALAEAAARDAEVTHGHLRGPLHGIPLSVKDVIHVAGVPTRAGSEAYWQVPGRDAPAVTRLREAGAVIIGKTTTHEFALGLTTPQSRNPHDPARVPGGSSGGSAIAVATGMGLGSIGTDTRASIRIPAALSGVVGFKATFGKVPADGLVQLSWTLDHVGPIASTVADAALLLDVLEGISFSRTVGAEPSSLRVGVPPDGCSGADPEVAAAFEAAIERLRALAGAVVEVCRPSSADFDEANAAGLIVSRCEAAAYHRALALDRTLYWPETRDQLEAADRTAAIDYLHAQRFRAELSDAMLGVFSGVDVLAMPASLVPAPLVEEAEGFLMLLSRNALLWSFVGFPAVSIPCGATSAGLPVGLQLVAPPHEEPSLVGLGTAFESAV